MHRNIITLLALGASGATAAVNFAPATIVGSGAGDTHFSGSVRVADLDSDGQPDLFVEGGGNRWFLNRLAQGSGFVAASGALGSAGHLLADVDGDGLTDSYGHGSFFPGDGMQRLTFFLRRGQPGGQFAAEESFDFGTLPAGTPGLFLHDRDGDGDLDITLFAGPTWTSLTNGGTSFIPVHSGSITPPSGTAIRLAGDLDADGLLDFVVGSGETGPRQILRGTADGNLSAAPDLLLDSAGTTAVWTADIDGDGRQDVLQRRAPDIAQWEIRLLLRQADGSLVESDALLGRDARSFSRAFFVATPTLLDLDGDGRPELVAQTGPDACPGPYACPASLTNPYGFSWLAFSTTGQITESAAYDGGLFAFADFDGDGRGDALGARSGNLVLRRGVTTANSAPVIPAEQHLQVPIGDGDLDGWLHLGATDVDEQLLTLRVIEAPNRSGATLTVSGGWVHYDRGRRLTGGQDSFTVEVDDGAGGTARTRVDVEIEGIGGGGALDFFGLAMLGALSFLHRVRSRGLSARPMLGIVMACAILGGTAQAAVNLMPPQQMAAESMLHGSSRVLIGDLDGDGRRDVLWARAFTVWAYRSFGRPDMSVIQTTLSAAQNYSPSLGNFDSTPGQDLVTAEWTGGSAGTATVVVHLNDGAGRFRAGQRLVLSGAYRTPSLQVVDLDADGDDDVLAYGAADGSLRILSNDGAGTLSVSATLASVAGYSWPRAVDADLDGRVDLWYPRSVSEAAGPGLLAPGLPGGGFGPAAVTDAPGTANHHLLDLDLDDDGDLDRVAVNLGLSDPAPRLFTWRREAGALLAWGDTTLSPPSYHGLIGPWALLSERHFGDLDGDGRPEYVRRVSTPEIAWVTPGSRAFEIFTLEDDGRFVAQPARFAMHWTEDSDDVLVADLDDDGRADILDSGRVDPYADDFQLLLRRATALPNAAPVVDEDAWLTIDLRPSGICCMTPGASVPVQDADSNQLMFTIVRQGLQGRASFVDPYHPFIRYSPDAPRLAVEDTVDVRIEDGAGGVITVRLRILAVGNPDSYGGGASLGLLLIGALGLLRARTRHRV